MMTTHKAAPAAAARYRLSAGGRAPALKSRYEDRILNLRAKGATHEGIADACRVTAAFVRQVIARARGGKDGRALTDKAAARIAADRALARSAEVLRAARRVKLAAEREARAEAREAARRAKAEAEARRDAEIAAWRVREALDAAEEAVAAPPLSAPPPPSSEPAAVSVDMAGAPGLGLDPASLGPKDCARFVSLLRARADKYPETSNQRAHTHHLADLYEHCSSFYPIVSIRASGLTIRRFSPGLIHSPMGSPAAMCAAAD